MKPHFCLFTLAAVLLLLLGIGVWRKWAPGRSSPPPSTDPHSVSLDVQIKKLEARSTGDHAQLVLTAVFDQSGQTPVRLEPPLVRLLNAAGTPVPRFIGPLLPDPVLPGPDPAEVTLHYWLPLTDLKTPLTLEASGRSYPLTYQP